MAQQKSSTSALILDSPDMNISFKTDNLGSTPPYDPFPTPSRTQTRTSSGESIGNARASLWGSVSDSMYKRRGWAATVPRQTQHNESIRAIKRNCDPREPFTLESQRLRRDAKRTRFANMVLKLSLACWDYDRIKALEDGRVQPEGISLTFLNYRVEETFFRQLRFQEFDVSELSLSSYVLTLNQENPPFIALPVFPSRFFRHQSMYINQNAGIKTPIDLKGKRIGIPEYQMTAAVWQRGILAEDFGVPIDQVQFFVGALEPSAHERKSKIPHSLPPGVTVIQIQPDQNLSQMLEEGEIDAIFSASKPSCVDRVSHCDYLFPDFKTVEAQYYRKTKIFPIMHVIAIKRAVYDQNPWVAKTLQKAFAASMDIAKQALRDRAALRYMLPWLEDHVRETNAIMGPNGWQDGFEENKHVIEKFLQYSYEQGLAQRLFKPEELFAPNTLDEFVI